MISEFETKNDETLGNILEEVIERLRTHCFVKHESRSKFVSAVCEERTKDALGKIVTVMVNNYTFLFKQNAKGKQFGHFEQAWLNHIDDYFTEPTSTASETNCYSAWKSVMDKCSSECACDVGEQRIVVSTLAYIVYDAMTIRVKEYKSKMLDIDKTMTSSDCSDQPLAESNVSLYRYGGFAIHSLLQKYKEREDPCSQAIVVILKKMVIKHEELCLLPSGVQLLNRGGLVIISPSLLPYLRALIEKVSSLVNEERCREYGQYMIDVARLAIEDDSNINSSFIRCIQAAGVDSKCPIIPQVYSELSKKLFHARVNEYMTAAVEIELEKNGKAVKADQCLRDHLKTFSGMKKR